MENIETAVQHFLSDPKIQAQIVSLILTGISAWVVRLVRPAVRIIWGVQHGFTFSVPRNDGKGINLVHTGTVIVKNEGGGTAKDVEVILNYKPEHYQVWPAMIYTTSQNPEGNLSISLQTLASQEWLTIEMVSMNLELPRLLRVRSPAGTVKEVGLQPAKVFSKPIIIGLYMLLLLGVFAIFENLYLLIFWW